MKRITITLTDAEYDALEYTAQQERRSVRDMAAYLVTKHAQQRPVTMGGLTIRTQPQTWIQNGCAACHLTGAGLTHTCLTGGAYASQFTATNSTLRTDDA